MNAVESFAPFATMALIANATGVSNAATKSCAAAYFYARVAHVAIHISGFGLLMDRTVAFTVACVAFVVFSVAVVQRST